MQCNVDQSIIEHLIEKGEQTIKNIIRFSISSFAKYNGYDEVEYYMPKIKYGIPDREIKSCGFSIQLSGMYIIEENTMYLKKSGVSLLNFISTIVHESIHAAQYIYDSCIEELLFINDRVFYYDSLIEQEARILVDYITPTVFGSILLPFYKQLYDLISTDITNNLKHSYRKDTAKIIDETISFVSKIISVQDKPITYADAYRQIKIFYNISQVLISIDESYNSLFNANNFINKRIAKLNENSIKGVEL